METERLKLFAKQGEACHLQGKPRKAFQLGQATDHGRLKAIFLVVGFLSPQPTTTRQLWLKRPLNDGLKNQANLCHFVVVLKWPKSPPKKTDTLCSNGNTVSVVKLSSGLQLRRTPPCNVKKRSCTNKFYKQFKSFLGAALTCKLLTITKDRVWRQGNPSQSIHPEKRLRLILH